MLPNLPCWLLTLRVHQWWNTLLQLFYEEILRKAEYFPCWQRNFVCPQHADLLCYFSCSQSLYLYKLTEFALLLLSQGLNLSNSQSWWDLLLKIRHKFEWAKVDIPHIVSNGLVDFAIEHFWNFFKELDNFISRKIFNLKNIFSKEKAIMQKFQDIRSQEVR